MEEELLERIGEEKLERIEELAIADIPAEEIAELLDLESEVVQAVLYGEEEWE